MAAARRVDIGADLVQPVTHIVGELSNRPCGTKPFKQRNVLRRIGSLGALVVRVGVAVSIVALVMLSVPHLSTGEAARHIGGTRRDFLANVCSGAEVKSVVRRVVNAFNLGDIAVFDGLIATEPGFKWFSVGGAPGRRVGSASTKRSTLTRYVQMRHKKGERLTLLRLRFQGTTKTAARIYGNFNFTVIRRARDYPARMVPGKGAADCAYDPPRIMVWALGGRSIGAP